MLVRTALAGLASLLLSTSAVAYPIDFGQVGINPNFSGGTGPFLQSTNSTPPSGLVDVSGSATGGFDSSGSGASHVDWGLSQLQADSAGSLNSVVRGFFRDSLTITAAGIPTGTFGSLTFSVLVTGTLAASGGVSRAGWQLQADLGGGFFDIGKAASFNSSGATPGYVGDAFGVYSATVQFQFGMATPLDVELSGSAQTSYSEFPQTTLASATLGAYWGGIQGVTVAGVAVDDFSVASESGTDYLQAVPEPDELVLEASALALCGVCLPKRRPRRRR